MDATLLKGLGILERVVAADAPCGVTALARDTGLPKSNVHRTLSSLLEAGYLLYDPAERLYYPSLKLAELGRRVAATFPFKAAVDPYLDLLARETGESAHFAVLEGENAFFMSSVVARGPLASVLPEGLRLPWPETAFGVAIAATIEDHAPDGSGTARDAVTEARRTGFAVQRDHAERHSFEIAVAISSGWGRTLGAIGISGPATRFSEDDLATRVAAVCRVAQNAGRDMANLSEGARARRSGS